MARELQLGEFLSAQAASDDAASVASEAAASRMDAVGTSSRGRLRIYLGAAPGVGKTFRMLDEAHRRAERGTDVAVAVVETHNRPLTAQRLEGLEVLPRRAMAYRGTTFTEMDLDAVLARHPEVAVVDELAHSNIPGSTHEKRWQDVEALLEAGIDVLSTVNIQHLESLNDVVETITGVHQNETVPDPFVRSADQVEIVDMTPEALRRRMAHGNVYAPDKVDAALANYFRVGNLTALRELALLWLADKVDDQLDRYRTEHDIGRTWETRERVIVALTGGPEGDTLIRRAARIADRSAGAELLAVHVSRSDGLTGANPANLSRQRALVESLGGSYHQVVGDDVPAALIAFARAENGTQLVLGASRRGRLAQILSAGIGVTTTNLSGAIDVHMVTHAEMKTAGRLPRLSRGLTARRRLFGAVCAAAILPALTVVLSLFRGSVNATSDVLLYLLIVVAVALIGGFWPALATAIAGSLLLNYFFFPPIHTFTIAQTNNVLAIAVFGAVAVMVSLLVDLAARRTSEAARAQAEASTLSVLAGSVLRGEEALPAILERMRETFGMTSVSLLEGDGDSDRPDPTWRCVASVGPEPCMSPEVGDTELAVRGGLHLVLRGRVLPAEDRRVLSAFANTAAVALEQRRLAEAAAEAQPLLAADRTRTALLAAVSHDLRTPLSSAKAAVNSLRSSDVDFSPEDREELLATADESLDRLNRLVDNVLDMSRLSAGAVQVTSRTVGLDDVVALALDGLDLPAGAVTVSIPDDALEVLADAGLLERVVANLISNALRHAPSDRPPVVATSRLGNYIELRVVDRGPGVPDEEWERIFVPFQRLGDRDNSAGMGLGLALARGLTEAMDGTLTPEHTPGGGLTMVVSLPAAAAHAPVPSITIE